MRKDFKFELEVLSNQITFIFFKLDELDQKISELDDEISRIRRTCLEER